MVKCISSLVMLLLCWVSASAQSEKPVEVYLASGGAFPTGDFNVRYDFGFNGSAGLGFRVAPHFRLVVKFEVQSFNLDQKAFFDAVSGGDHVSLMTGVDFRFFKHVPSWPVSPLLLFGGGMAYSSESQLTVGTVTYNTQTETKPYFNIGVGVNVRAGHQIGVFVVGRYVRISSGYTETEFFPITVGIRYPS